MRALAAQSAVELLSCSNDATIRKWNVDTGECLEVFHGHKHYIYRYSILMVLTFIFVFEAKD